MRCLLDCPTLLVLVSGVALAIAQYDDGGYGAPSPPRLVIPGAVSLGPAPPRRVQSRPQGRRQQFIQPEDLPPTRSRPTAARAGRLPLASGPTPGPQFLTPSIPIAPQRPIAPVEDPIPPRPVIEESEDDFEDDDIPSSGPYSPSPAQYSPSPSPSTPPPPPPPPPQRPVPNFRPERPAFRPERPAILPTPAPELNFVSPTRQQVRTEDRQSQPQFSRAQSVVRTPPKQAYPGTKQQDFEKPIRQHQRPRKPVAQVLRRYREDNPDGSITWGFENDDGSFKEETIGTDCVTYGKYGYVDPDGTRREYTYNTGIPCDKNKLDSQEQPSEGYIDYAENKYVLPGGQSIDLNSMVKNRARKPVQPQYRN